METKAIPSAKSLIAVHRHSISTPIMSSSINFGSLPGGIRSSRSGGRLERKSFRPFHSTSTMLQHNTEKFNRFQLKLITAAAKDSNIAGKDDDVDHANTQMIKAFFESRAGVKGLVDSGITKIPSIFIHPPPPETLPKPSFEDEEQHLQIPEIDLQGFESEPKRTEIVDAIRDAAETWGIFRMVNHGVPISIMENMLEGVRQFHEQPPEVKKAWYSRKLRGQRNLFDSNTNVKVAAWRDTVACEFPHGVIDQEIIPEICREATSEYLKCIFKLKQTLCELLAEALGLRRDYLASFERTKGALIACHYFPACPEPELTLGTSRHTDASVLTILLESNVDALQVLHQGQWVDVPHRRGYLIANIGDLLQILSNGKFKSVPHRVLATSSGPRISAACLFAPTLAYGDEPIGPAEELVSEESPPIYKGISVNQYLPFFKSKDRDGTIALPHFKIST